MQTAGQKAAWKESTWAATTVVRKADTKEETRVVCWVGWTEIPMAAQKERRRAAPTETSWAVRKDSLTAEQWVGG